MLYLIDTTNGEMRIQQNIIATSRLDYAFCDYNTKHVWGNEHAADGKMCVMTYAGFGSEVRNAGSSFNWFGYDYIICDEMQNLVDYQRFSARSANLEAAENALRAICAEGSTKIVAMSATPKKIWDRFGGLCYDVHFDRSDLINLCTTNSIPYSGTVQELLDANKGKTGILYVTEITKMKQYIEYANSIGFHANGFWSISPDTLSKHPMSQDQMDLRKNVLVDETIPVETDLLVINRASETCIKIQEKKRKVDFIIVHDKNEEIKTQVRGRYHGDLETFYYHSVDDTNRARIANQKVPSKFLNRPLYTEDMEELRWKLKLLRPDGTHYGNPTFIKYLKECGYNVSDAKKDRKQRGKYYWIITEGETISGQLL